MFIVGNVSPHYGNTNFSPKRHIANKNQSISFKKLNISDDIVKFIEGNEASDRVKVLYEKIKNIFSRDVPDATVKSFEIKGKKKVSFTYAKPGVSDSMNVFDLSPEGLKEGFEMLIAKASVRSAAEEKPVVKHDITRPVINLNPRESASIINGYLQRLKKTH